MLGPIGFQLALAELDFDARPLDRSSVEALFSRLGADYECWLVEQTIMRDPVSFYVTAAIENFFDLWIEMPFRRRTGGC